MLGKWMGLCPPFWISKMNPCFVKNWVYYENGVLIIKLYHNCLFIGQKFTHLPLNIQKWTTHSLFIYLYRRLRAFKQSKVWEKLGWGLTLVWIPSRECGSAEFLRANYATHMHRTMYDPPFSFKIIILRTVLTFKKIVIVESNYQIVIQRRPKAIWAQTKNTH